MDGPLAVHASKPDVWSVIGYRPDHQGARLDTIDRTLRSRRNRDAARGVVRTNVHAMIEGIAKMTYRTYSGPRGSGGVSPLEKDRLLYKEFDTLDGALGWARHLNEGGRTALLIEGDDGTRLEKREILAALNHPESSGLGKAS